MTIPVSALSLSTDKNHGGPVIVNILCINASDMALALRSFVGTAKTKLVCLQVANTMYLKLAKPSSMYFMSTAKCSKGI